MRGSYAPVTWPNAVPTSWALLSRLLNSVWLRTLNASTRSSSVIRSRYSGVVFTSDISRFVRPGPRNTLRGAVPYPVVTTLLKDAGSKTAPHSFWGCDIELAPLSSRPTFLGRTDSHQTR